jgi:cobalt/nickel transport system ATP-binding protein
VLDAAIEAKNLIYAYDGASELCQRCGGHRAAAIDNLSLRVERGQRLAILGANGSGKSTLLLLLNGTLRPMDGHVRLDGRPADYSRSGLMRWRQKVGLVFQDPDDQLFAATIYQDVSYGPLNLGLPEAEARHRTDEALALLGIADLADSPVHMLSGGQRKRAAIAGIMAMRPEVLILDEPTAGMDATGSTQFLAFLDRLSASGTTVVLAIHDTDLALAWADSVVVLAHGRVARQGVPQEVLIDQEFVATAHLRMPSVLEGFRLAYGPHDATATDRIPRTMEQLVRLLQSNTADGDILSQ